MTALLQVDDLSKRYRTKQSVVDAVSHVSLEIKPGEVFGIVGESGSGKSTLARTILQLEEPTSGQIFFEGRNLATLSRGQMKATRQKMQVVFQDPYASLNPRMTVLDIVGEGLDIHRLARGSARRYRVHELLEMVGLPADCASRFPHEFSGGQRQRICIARALAPNPSFLICDEPVSALDLSIQAQIVNLLKELQTRMNLTYLFIAHDLSLVRYFCNRVGVMYQGHLVEVASAEQLFTQAEHPYTQALLSAIPLPDPRAERTRCAPTLQQFPRPKVPELREIAPGHLLVDA